MNDMFKPGIMLSETHFPYLDQDGLMPDAVGRIVDEGFYRHIEIADIKRSKDRERIGVLVRGSGVALAQWMSLVLAREELNLSSVNDGLRKKSVARMREMIEPAVECGASTFSVLPGPDPGSALRAQATEQLYRSLVELCEALDCSSSIRLMLEPLDRGAHKNGLLGPTSEFVTLFRRLRQSFPSAGVSWDTAHVVLCGDDLFDSFERARDVTLQIHLANAVLDSTKEGFGDNHMDIGPPGFLTVEKIARLLRQGVESGFLPSVRPSVAAEIRTPRGGDPWETVARGRQVLEEAWNLCISTTGNSRGDD